MVSTNNSSLCLIIHTDYERPLVASSASVRSVRDEPGIWRLVSCSSWNNARPCWRQAGFTARPARALSRASGSLDPTAPGTRWWRWEDRIPSYLYAHLISGAVLNRHIPAKIVTWGTRTLLLYAYLGDAGCICMEWSAWNLGLEPSLININVCFKWKNVRLLIRCHRVQSLISHLCPAGVFEHIFRKAVYYLGGSGGEYIWQDSFHCSHDTYQVQQTHVVKSFCSSPLNSSHLTFHSSPRAHCVISICLLSPARKWLRPHRSQSGRSCRTLSKSEWPPSPCLFVFASSPPLERQRYLYTLFRLSHSPARLPTIRPPHEKICEARDP